MYQFSLEGVPINQARARSGKYGNFYDPSGKAKKGLGMALIVARQTHAMPLFKSDLGLSLAFSCSRGSGRKIDIDNLCKAFLDAGNGVLWKDDSQIIHLDAWKYYCEKGSERTDVQINEL